MKLTCIVPAYNAAETIIDTLVSIRLQTVTDWECIMVDDGSDDNTAELMQRFADMDPRFKIVSIKHGGVSKALNLGISMAKGDYFCVVGADDQIGKRRFEHALIAAQASGAAIVMCAILPSSGKKIGLPKSGFYNINDPKFFVSPNYDIGHSGNKLWMTDFIRGRFSFDEECDYLEDWLFNIEVSFSAGGLYYIDKEDYYWTVHSGSLCHSLLTKPRIDGALNAFERQQKRIELLTSRWQKYLMSHFFTRALLRHYDK